MSRYLRTLCTVKSACARMMAEDATLTSVDLTRECRARRAAVMWAAGSAVDAAGAAAVAEALMVNKTVTTIDLSSACRAAGARAARGARRAACGGILGGVSFLLLTGARGLAADNAIRVAGAATIAEALKVNKTVTTTNLACACRAAGARAAGGGSVGGVTVVLLTGGARGAARAARRARSGGRQQARRRWRGGYRGGAEGERDGHDC